MVDSAPTARAACEHLFRHLWALSRLVTALAELGCEVVEVDAASYDGADSLRDALIAAIDAWPSDYGRGSWPGFNDGLMDCLLTAENPLVVVVLKSLDQVRGKDETSVLALLELCAATSCTTCYRPHHPPSRTPDTGHRHVRTPPEN
ncbi:MAG: hypothetical protein ABIQ18_26085 [Umezawaea sp.]